MNVGRSILAAVFFVSALAQAQDLPKEISGRWTRQARGASQTFSRDNIQRKEGSSFAATLTWWTIDPKCAIRSVPITGRVTDTGRSFDATTKCDVSFTAELNRSASGWQGKGTTKGENAAVVDLKAN